MSTISLPKRKIKLQALLLIVLLPVFWAQAEEGIIYKASRPFKGSGAEAKTVQGGPYLYDPVGKIDPFKPFLMEGTKEGRLDTKKVTILETLDLSQLELIAIMVGPKGNWAMVRDSKGVGHVIQKGTLIGTKGGIVDKITENEVVIKEEFKDFRGNKQYKEIIKKTSSSLL
jgi:Tfp pilus assembly protein PilP